MKPATYPDAVVGLALVARDATLLVAGENGIGKRTPFDMVLEDGRTEPVYRLQSRGGVGIITMKANEKTGGVVGALTVRDNEEIMLITEGGQMVRTFVKDIRETGRNAQGVKLIELEGNDKLQAIAQARGAALADGGGIALDATLVRHGAAPRTVREVPVRFVRRPKESPLATEMPTRSAPAGTSSPIARMSRPGATGARTS